ncbi:hypothetical protein LDENG_00291160 [Lucifuga dentata]|nr:hypothetical protein LDENG_00291160 [Lucifuga dentata]
MYRLIRDRSLSHVTIFTRVQADRCLLPAPILLPRVLACILCNILIGYLFGVGVERGGPQRIVISQSAVLIVVISTVSDRVYNLNYIAKAGLCSKPNKELNKRATIMFQRLTSLLFGEVEEVAAELKGPNPCVTEADEEGWMLVNLPGETDCMMQDEGETETPLITQSFPDNYQSNHQDTHTRTECPTPVSRPPHKRRRTHKGRVRGAVVASDPLFCPSASPSDSGAATPVTLLRRARLFTPSSTPSMSPGSGSERGGSGGSSRAHSERGCMDESWFVTPPPCFTAEGATAEASPMEDLLIEHPSMSVYVSPSNLSMVSNSNLSVVGEESIVSLLSNVSRVGEPAAAPATLSALPTRVSRGAAAQAGALAKVTQVARVQRSKARLERRHLSRNRIQRQNRMREQVPRHVAHARNTFLHQPSKRNFCH